MNTKEKSRKSFDKQAYAYDTSDYSKYPRECYPFVMEALKGIKFKNILDLGCGTGAILEQINNTYTFAELYGIDLSEKMIEQAKQRLDSKAVLSTGDAENLPYEENSFDLVCCVESFHHYPNPRKALSEIRRILKQDGTFLLCDTWSKRPVRQIMNFFIRFSDDGDVHIYSKREIINLLAEADFKSISWRKITNHAYLCSSQKL